MDNISVLICDDSALMRNLIGRIIEDVEGFTVVAKAENGLDLLEKIPQCKPDVILLDIEMPKMNGVEFLRKRRDLKIDVPVIILSSVATEGAAVTMECLSLGAADFITKPGSASVTLKIGDVSADIIEKISSYGRAQALMSGKNIPDADYFIHQSKLKEAQKVIAQKKGEEAAKKAAEGVKDLFAASHWNPPKPKEPVVIHPVRECGKIELIAIGISTGGPNALREVFKNLDKNIKQPILVVQHMPAGFTEEFAHSLNAICPLTVTEAKNGEPLLGGHIYIAPGGSHMYVEHQPLCNIIRTNQEDPRNGHRPSVDVMFESIAKVYQNRALGVIMTGMGRDGAAQLAEMRKQGAWTLGQDSASSIVYGMPKVAYELGGVQKQVSLENMAKEINLLAMSH
ncbi:MAG: chemotaxis response regulator protein-glutamate methylesterase [Treponema sp.]|nr:chemotaxis response regulator protein-glutamate methylesterase [Treponema sp.]